MFWIYVLGFLVLGGIAAFYIMRMLKGKVRINLYKTDFTYGEPITGSVSVWLESRSRARDSCSL